MQNCYTVVSTRDDGTNRLHAVFYTYEGAVNWTSQQFVAGLEDVQVLEVALVPVERKTPLKAGSEQHTHRLDMIELRHEIRTLRTLLTALNGRVAELSGAQGTK